jgi:hypothetical protein
MSEAVLPPASPAVPVIEVICVTYRQDGPLRVLVQSFLNQTAANWKLQIIHDGPDPAFDEMMAAFAAGRENRITFWNTDKRYNDYGHSLREQGLRRITGDYILITNGDNYYVPVFVRQVTERIMAAQPDVVLFNMVHSRGPGGRRNPRYSFFETSYRRRAIDMGSAIVRADLARAAGFRDKGFAGDATYFEDVAVAKAGPLHIEKLEDVLFVHN